MKEMLVSKFKAGCVSIVNEVASSGQEILVTKRGQPLVRIIPAQATPTSERVPGDSADLVQIRGDLVSFDSSGDWEGLQG